MKSEVPRGTGSINQTRIAARIPDTWLECHWRHHRYSSSLYGSFRGFSRLWAGFSHRNLRFNHRCVATAGVNQQRERLALRLIGAAFFALAVYILAQITVILLTQTHPAPSIAGIVWLGATFIAMLLLAYGKHVTGKQLGNVVLMTEGMLLSSMPILPVLS
jgi:hypothetical protein